MQSEWLGLLAEISAALAGFAALAGLLGRERFDRLAIYGVVETSLIVLLFSLLPHVVGSIRISAAGFFAVYSVAWVNGARESVILRRSGQGGGYPLIAVVAFGVALLGSLLSGAVALDVSPRLSPHLYEAAIFCCRLNSCALLWLALRRFLFPDRRPPAA